MLSVVNINCKFSIKTKLKRSAMNPQDLYFCFTFTLNRPYVLYFKMVCVHKDFLQQISPMQTCLHTHFSNNKEELVKGRRASLKKHVSNPRSQRLFRFLKLLLFLNCKCSSRIIGEAPVEARTVSSIFESPSLASKVFLFVCNESHILSLRPSSAEFQKRS